MLAGFFLDSYIPGFLRDRKSLLQIEPSFRLGEGGQVGGDLFEAGGAFGLCIVEIGELFGGLEGEGVEFYFGLSAGGADGDVVAGGGEVEHDHIAFGADEWLGALAEPVALGG